jgi:hypothetical protein
MSLAKLVVFLLTEIGINAIITGCLVRNRFAVGHFFCAAPDIVKVFNN